MAKASGFMVNAQPLASVDSIEGREERSRGRKADRGNYKSPERRGRTGSPSAH